MVKFVKNNFILLYMNIILASIDNGNNEDSSVFISCSEDNLSEDINDNVTSSSNRFLSTSWVFIGIRDCNNTEEEEELEKILDSYDIIERDEVEKVCEEMDEVYKRSQNRTSDNETLLEKRKRSISLLLSNLYNKLFIEHTNKDKLEATQKYLQLCSSILYRQGRNFITGPIPKEALHLIYRTLLFSSELLYNVSKEIYFTCLPDRRPGNLGPELDMDLIRQQLPLIIEQTLVKLSSEELKKLCNPTQHA